MQRLLFHTAMRKNKFFCELMSAEKHYSECMNYTEENTLDLLSQLSRLKLAYPQACFVLDAYILIC